MQILLVHDSPVVLKVLQNYFATEHSDWRVRAADSAAALLTLREGRFDLVVSGAEMRRSSVLDLRAVAAEVHSQPPAFVAMTSDSSPELRERLLRGGVSRVLQMPFDPAEMSAVIRTLRDPRHLRAHERYAIPGASLCLYLDEAEVEATVINVSVAGLLCELPRPDQLQELFQTPMLTLSLPREVGEAKVAGIRAGLMRLQVIGWSPTRHATRLRTAWSFLDMPDASQALLVRALSEVGRQLKEARMVLIAP